MSNKEPKFKIKTAKRNTDLNRKPVALRIWKSGRDMLDAISFQLNKVKPEGSEKITRSDALNFLLMHKLQVTEDKTKYAGLLTLLKLKNLREAGYVTHEGHNAMLSVYVPEGLIASLTNLADEITKHRVGLGIGQTASISTVIQQILTETAVELGEKPEAKLADLVASLTASYDGLL